MARHLFTLLLLSCVATAGAAQPETDFGECLNYAKPDGESFFAMVVKPKVERIDDRPHDVVVLMDTSASQVGLHREKALATVEHLMDALSPTDQVHLMAADLKAVSMSEGFVPPRSPEMRKAMEKLTKRTPLGATDMENILYTAAGAFAGRESDNPRAMLYIGDAMSRANLLPPKKIRKLVDRLVEQRIPFTGYALGPQWDAHLLGALVNNTGGLIALEEKERSATDYARFLANAAHGTVLWPVKVQMPERVVEFYPKPFPPLRSDRDSVIIGRGKLVSKFTLGMLVEVNGRQHRLNWPIEPHKPDDSHGFLVELVAAGRKADGAMLPTVGSAGLIEARRSLNADLQKLVKLATEAIRSGNFESAEQLGRKAQDIDPTGPDVNLILGRVKKEYLHLAREALGKQNFLVTEVYAGKVLDLDPSNNDARILREAAAALRRKLGKPNTPKPKKDLKVGSKEEPKASQ